MARIHYRVVMGAIPHPLLAASTLAVRTLRIAASPQGALRRALQQLPAEQLDAHSIAQRVHHAAALHSSLRLSLFATAIRAVGTQAARVGWSRPLDGLAALAAPQLHKATPALRKPSAGCGEVADCGKVAGCGKVPRLAMANPKSPRVFRTQVAARRRADLVAPLLAQACVVREVERDVEREMERDVERTCAPKQICPRDVPTRSAPN